MKPADRDGGRAEAVEAPQLLDTIFSLSLNQAGAQLDYLSGPRRAQCWRASQLEVTTGPQHPHSPPLGVMAVVCWLPRGAWHYLVWRKERGIVCVYRAQTPGPSVSVAYHVLYRISVYKLHWARILCGNRPHRLKWQRKDRRASLLY